MDAILVAIVAAAALACPVQMWWRMHRDERAERVPSSAGGPDAGQVAECQAALAERLATIERTTRAGYAGRR